MRKYVRYELTVIATPETTTQILESLTDMAQAAGFYTKKIEDEGVKPLCYPVDEHGRGRYLFTRIVTDDPDAPSRLTHLLEDRKSVLRFLLVKADDNF